MGEPSGSGNPSGCYIVAADGAVIHDIRDCIARP